MPVIGFLAGGRGGARPSICCPQRPQGTAGAQEACFSWDPTGGPRRAPAWPRRAPALEAALRADVQPRGARDGRARASREQRRRPPDGTRCAWSLPSPCATVPARRPGWAAWPASPQPAPRRRPRPLGSARPGCATSARTAAAGAASRPPRRPPPSAAARSGFWVAGAARPRAAPWPRPQTRPRSSHRRVHSAPVPGAPRLPTHFPPAGPRLLPGPSGSAPLGARPLLVSSLPLRGDALQGTLASSPFSLTCARAGPRGHLKFQLREPHGESVSFLRLHTPRGSPPLCVPSPVLPQP